MKKKKYIKPEVKQVLMILNEPIMKASSIENEPGDVDKPGDNKDPDIEVDSRKMEIGHPIWG